MGHVAIIVIAVVLVIGIIVIVVSVTIDCFYVALFSTLGQTHCTLSQVVAARNCIYFYFLIANRVVHCKMLFFVVVIVLCMCVCFFFSNIKWCENVLNP